MQIAQTSGLFLAITVCVTGLAQGQEPNLPPPLPVQEQPPAYPYAPPPGSEYGELLKAPYANPANPDSPVKTTVGVAFFRPYWSRNSFALPAPAGAGTAFIGDSRDVTDSFNFAPVFSVKYNPKADVPLPSSAADYFTGIAVSGIILNLSSTLNRSLASGGTNLTLQSSNQLGITVLNAPEVTATIDGKNMAPWFQNQKINLHTGLRYSGISQAFSSTLLGPGAATHLDSKQQFNGGGATAMVEWQCALQQPTYFQSPYAATAFTRVRGSALVGQNDRSSAYLGQTSVPGIPPSASVSESRTSFVPVGELDLGVEFKTAAQSLSKYRADVPPPKIKLILAFMGQIWGNVGMPSALSLDNRPNNGSLYLVGFFVASGVDF